jgi:hypothetical protein
LGQHSFLKERTLLSFKPRVKSSNRWHGKNIVFASRREAQGFASDVAAIFRESQPRVTAWRVAPSREAVSHTYLGCVLAQVA